MVEIKGVRDYLASIDFFTGMKEEHVELISGCGELVQFKAGEFLIKEGDKAEKFYVIREGEATIETYVPGQGAKIMMTVKKGGIVGYSWLFEPYRSSFDVRALTDMRAIQLDGACLRGKAENDHELGYHLMNRVARVILKRLHASRQQMVDVYEKLERKGA
ncbi:MAG: cyclic nucleotide-binding domain-containing protein [Alphaproteobacteria bacterium]|nr:cyclic nucleotide-binding domain-containing protein [Alphaproteobacteria bacterium]